MNECHACGAIEGAFPITVEWIFACNCYNRTPTPPVFRDDRTHLADCPMYGSNFPVGRLVPRVAMTAIGRHITKRAPMNWYWAVIPAQREAK